MLFSRLFLPRSLGDPVGCEGQNLNKTLQRLALLLEMKSHNVAYARHHCDSLAIYRVGERQGLFDHVPVEDEGVRHEE